MQTVYIKNSKMYSKTTDCQEHNTNSFRVVNNYNLHEERNKLFSFKELVKIP